MASALSALLQRSEIIDHEEVLEACNQTLANTPPTAKDATLTTSHVKVVALLKLDRFDDALRVLEAGGEPLKRVAAFEWAYALYKTGKLEEAVDIARSLSNSGDATGGGRRAMHLEAQASYRAEKFARAAKIYEGLLRVADGEGAAPSEDSDLRVNAGAVDAQLQLAAPGESTAVKTPTSLRCGFAR
ncbi:Signal recognition particle core component [Ascosphaera atra]|nr:Signal recognition particle core component [Ascosphaera atra]